MSLIWFTRHIGGLFDANLFFATYELMNPDELHRDAVVIDGLIIAGWNEARIRKVIGGNWLALLDEVWKA